MFVSNLLIFINNHKTFRLFLILTFSFLLFSNLLYSSPPDENINKGDYVIILHGIARSNKHMESLAQYLEQSGFEVINLNYPSTSHNIEEITEIINQENSAQITKDKKINFIGYSLGGLITRA